MELNKEKVILFWSGGKDSALTLYKLKKELNYDVVCILTTLNEETNHVPFHGLPDKMLVEQSKMLDIPLQRVYLSESPTNEEYKKEVGKILAMFAKKGIRKVAFGDINQKEIRAFKDQFLAELEMEGIYPLWGLDTLQVAKEFMSTGHKAIVTSVLLDALDGSYLAKEFNVNFIESLPSNVDPSGENGEFHTFCIYGPYFKMRVPFSKAIAIDEGPYLVSLIKEP